MHMRRSITLAVSTAVLVMATALPAVANDAAIGGVGGAITPITVADIRMESEAVQVVAYAHYAVVRVDFKFVNSGEERVVKLGFPFELPFEKQDLSDLPPAAGFRAWQDGAPLAVTWTPPSRGDAEPEGGFIGYFVHEATFKPGVTMIRVEYLAEPNSQVPTPDIPSPPDKYKGMMSSKASYEYWVHTGAGWAGTIGKSVIRFTLSPDFEGWGTDAAQKMWAAEPQLPAGTGEVALSYTKADPQTYQWTFLDYEPTVEKGQLISKYDVSLHYFQPSWVDKDFNETFLPEWPRDHVVKAEASSQLKLGEFEYPPDAAFKGVAWAWAEGVTGSGTGQWVKATFAGERSISEVRILPGYAKSPALFAKYNRPKTLTLEFSDGTKKTLQLADEPSLQKFPVNAKASWAKVTIGEVYRGTTRDETYLSLVDFGATSPEFASFAQVVGEKPASQDSSGALEATGTPATGAATGSAFPAWLILVAVIAAGVAGLALIGGAVFLLMRSKKP
jgi:hypothetical protein